MGEVKKDLRRLQCLFEHCCLNTMINLAKQGGQVNFFKGNDGNYISPEAEDLFALWLAGRNQGVADQAFASGAVQL